MADSAPSIRDFQLTNILGKGSMGEVWQAHRKDTGEWYAIKTIAKTASTVVDRLIEEREILASVNNPFVIRLHWVFQDDSRVYFVLDHAKGGDLLSVMHNFHPGGMSESHARFYFAEILLALEYLHGMGIVVRDLKPSNCLTTETGHIMLTDFGHSERLPGNIDRSNNEHDNGVGSAQCVGTPEYMAPETLQDHPATKMGDYWSLGITLYELMFACMPWGSRADTGIEDLFFEILTQPVFSADEENDGIGAGARAQPPTTQVSEAARHLITRLLEKDPSNRLGADVASVKAHTFFNQPGLEMDWAAAQRGELVPPPRELPLTAVAAPASENLPRRGTPVQWLRVKPFPGPPTSPPSPI
jgi:serine/threonine protein kinase